MNQDLSLKTWRSLSVIQWDRKRNSTPGSLNTGNCSETSSSRSPDVLDWKRRPSRGYEVQAASSYAAGMDGRINWNIASRRCAVVRRWIGRLKLQQFSAGAGVARATRVGAALRREPSACRTRSRSVEKLRWTSWSAPTAARSRGGALHTNKSGLFVSPPLRSRRRRRYLYIESLCRVIDENFIIYHERGQSSKYRLRLFIFNHRK